MRTADAYSFLMRHRYGVVSSVSSGGVPQSALVGIAVTPDLEIIFDTLRSSRKYANLCAHPNCSFVIGWDDEKTVQLEGAVFEPAGADLERYQQRCFSVWPDGPSRKTWAGIVWLVVKPRWVRYSDYAQSPPVVEEMLI